jgi:uncharacterized protein with GYD domain
MPKYLVQANYMGDGLHGLMQEGGTARRTAVEKLLASVGGKVEAFYYAFGDVDVFVIVDVPDNVTATALALTINASDSVSATMTVLVTPEEVDAAVQKNVSYRAPGQ